MDSNKIPVVRKPSAVVRTVKKGPSRIRRINGKLYDFGTRNHSFLQVARDLRTLGIRNCYFMLEIKDPTLVGIDPYATDEDGNCTLTQDQIARVIVECRLNPWYYLREVALIPAQGAGGVHYKANRGNIAQAYCIIKGLDSWLCLPRQKGKTQSAIAIIGWAYNFGTTNSAFIFTNENGDKCKENLNRLKAQLLLLPSYMQFEYIINGEGKRVLQKRAATGIQHPVTSNKVSVTAKATSYDKAMNLARGLTAPIIYYDEPEFTSFIDVIVENSVSTYEEAAKNAKKNNAMYARIFTCTPGDLDTAPGAASQRILNKTRKWTEQIYDWTDQEIHEYIYRDDMKDKEGKTIQCNGILYIEYHYYQIGLSQSWLKAIAAKIGNPQTVRREILLQRLHGSSSSPYSKEDLEFIAETEQRPIGSIWLQKYFELVLYAKLQRSVPYLVGVDCASGTLKDANAITIIHPKTLKPVAELNCNYIGETKFRMLLEELVTEYVPKCCLCIERNNVGSGIIDYIMETDECPIRGNLYYDKDRNLMETKMRDSENVESILKTKATLKTYTGVWTGKQSREDMFAILARRISENKSDFVTHNIIHDISGLVQLASGRIEAGPGFHDDSVMSYLIALYVYYHGDNLAMFGIFRYAEDEDLNNSGMRRPEDINPEFVDQKLIDGVLKQQRMEAQKNSFIEAQRRAIIESQEASMREYKAGLTKNTIFEYTSNELMNDMEPLTGEIDLSLF